MRRGTNRTLLLGLTVALETTLYGCTFVVRLEAGNPGAIQMIFVRSEQLQEARNHTVLSTHWGRRLLCAHDLVGNLYAFVADVDPRTGDELADLVLGLLAERASQAVI